MTQQPTTAKQGHRYKVAHMEVLAMASGDTVEVCEIDRSRPWPLVRRFTVSANELTPQPMTYFGGEIPA